ncbi:hypothetical protein D1P53_005451 [Cryptococcus gattii VGV]|nr:hypothetical protein D1P53_005451 [Cryptococcus gattii VGV]
MPTTISFFIPDTSPIFTYTSTSSSLSNTFNSTSTSSLSSGGTNSVNATGTEVDEEGGWIAAYSPIGNGYDQTFHYGQGVISGNFSASALKFYTSLISSNSSSAASLSCPAEYRLNASSTWSSACLSPSSSSSASGNMNGNGNGEGDEYVIANLPAGTHQVELRSVGGNVGFMGIGGLLEVDSSGKMSNLTVDNTSPSLIYSPSTSWSQFSYPISSASSSSGNSSLTSLFNSTMDNFYNKTMSVTTEGGSKVELNFEGEAIYVYGFSSINGGKGEVRLDGVLQGNLNMVIPWDSYSSLLYVGSGFNKSNHTLTITNTSPGGQLVIDYVLLTVKASSSTSHLVLIIGIIGGTSAILLILGAIAYILYVRRRLPVRHKDEQSPYSFSKGYGNKDYMPQGSGSEVDLWQKMGGTSTLGSGNNLTASLTTSTPMPMSFARDERVNLTPGSGSRSGSGMGMGRTPPPDYPDYVPYRGPIEPPPIHTTNSSISGSGQEEVLAYRGAASSLSSASGKRGSIRSSSIRSSTPRLSLVAGTNPSATGWLLARGSQAWNISPISSRERGEGLSKGRSRTSVESCSAGELRSDKDREKDDEFDEIALSDQQPSISPPPFSDVTSPSSQSGQRSTDTRTTTVPQSPASAVSTTSSLGLSGIQVRAVPASRSVARLWPTRDAVPSSYRADSSFWGGMSALRSPRQVALNTSSLALNPSTSVDALSHVPNSASSPTLRRGVSIKSIKTMRSFFSGLIFLPPSSSSDAVGLGGNGASPIQSTPALPMIAARPDSDIFPVFGGLSRGSSKVDRSRIGKGYSSTSSTVPSTSGSGSTSKHHHVPALPITTPTSLSRRQGEEAGEEEQGDDGSSNFFIELNPNSPITASRSGSLWTRYT